MALTTSDNSTQNSSQQLMKEIRKYINYWYLIALSLIKGWRLSMGFKWANLTSVMHADIRYLKTT